MLTAMQSLFGPIALLTVVFALVGCGANGVPPELPGATTEVMIPADPAPAASASDTPSTESAATLDGWTDGGKGIPVGKWQGKCGEPGPSWTAVDGSLTFSATGDVLSVQGRLAFVGRKTRAELHGTREGSVFKLLGSMTEPSGLKTEWLIEIDVEAPRPDGGPLRVSLLELVSSDGARTAAPMCSFSWPQAQK